MVNIFSVSLLSQAKYSLYVLDCTCTDRPQVGPNTLLKMPSYSKSALFVVTFFGGSSVIKQAIIAQLLQQVRILRDLPLPLMLRVLPWRSTAELDVNKGVTQ